MLKLSTRSNLAAAPVDLKRINSPWLTAPIEALSGIAKVIGKSDYKAYEGANTGGLNGCFWISVLSRLPNNALLIENLHDIGKISVEHVQAAIEADLVYPLLRGRDIRPWQATPSIQILVAQSPETRIGYEEVEMKRKYPKTYSYLKHFELQLRDRSGFKKYFAPDDPFYSMYNVGTYTFAPWKVVWKDMGSFIQVGVVGKHEGKIVCPEHHVMAVSLDDVTEAHYLCAFLMSSPAQMVVACYTTTTGISAHVLENVAVPRFKADDARHGELAALSEKCHAAASVNDADTIKAHEAEIDTLAAQLWGISIDELASIQEALKEMKSKRIALPLSDAEEDVPQLVMEV